MESPSAVKDSRGRHISGAAPSGLEMTMSLSGPPGFNHQHTTVPTDSLYHYMNRVQPPSSSSTPTQQQQQSRPRSGSNSVGSAARSLSSDSVIINADGAVPQEMPPHLDARLIAHEAVARTSSKEIHHHQQGLSSSSSSGSRSHPPPSHPPPPLHHDSDGHGSHHAKDGGGVPHDRHHPHHQLAASQIPQHMPSLEHVPQQQQHHHHSHHHQQQHNPHHHHPPHHQQQQQHHPQQQHQSLPQQHHHQQHPRHYQDQRSGLPQDTGSSSRSSSRDNSVTRDNTSSRVLMSTKTPVDHPSPKESRTSSSISAHHEHLHAMYTTIQQSPSYPNQQIQNVPPPPTSRSMLSPHHYLPGKQIPPVASVSAAVAVGAPASSLTAHPIGLSPNASGSFGLSSLAGAASKLPSSSSDAQSSHHPPPPHHHHHHHNRQHQQHNPQAPGHPELSHPYLGAKGAAILHPDDHHKLMMASVAGHHYQRDMAKVDSHALLQQQQHHHQHQQQQQQQQQHQAADTARDHKLSYRESHHHSSGSIRNSFPSDDNNSKSSLGSLQHHRLHEHGMSVSATTAADSRSGRHSSSSDSQRHLLPVSSGNQSHHHHHHHHSSSITGNSKKSSSAYTDYLSLVHSSDYHHSLSSSISSSVYRASSNNNSNSGTPTSSYSFPPSSSSSSLSSHQMLAAAASSTASHYISPEQFQQHGQYSSSAFGTSPQAMSHKHHISSKSQSVIRHQNIAVAAEDRNNGRSSADWRSSSGLSTNKHLIAPVNEDGLGLNTRSLTPKAVSGGSLHPPLPPLSSSHQPPPLQMAAEGAMQGSISTGQPRVVHDSNQVSKHPGYPSVSSERYSNNDNQSLDRRQYDSHSFTPARTPHSSLEEVTSKHPHSEQQHQLEKQVTRATGTPLDLTKLNQQQSQPPGKSSDAPLDLTVKTKKRPLDAFTEHRSTPEFDRMLSAAKRPKLENSRYAQGSSSSIMPMNSSELFQNSVWTTPTASPRGSSEAFEHRALASPAYSSHTPSPVPGHKSSHSSNGRTSSDGRYVMDTGRSSGDSHVNGRSSIDNLISPHGVMKFGKTVPDLMKGSPSNPQMVPLTTQLQKVKEEQANQMKMHQRQVAADAASHSQDLKKSQRDGNIETTPGHNSEMIVVRHQQQQMPHLLSQAEFVQQQHAHLIQQQSVQRQFGKHAQHISEPLHVEARHHLSQQQQQQQQQMVMAPQLQHHHHSQPKPSPGGKTQQDIIELGMKDSSDPLQASRPIHVGSQPEHYVTAEQMHLQQKQRAFISQQLHPKKEQLSPFGHTSAHTYPKPLTHPSNQALYGKHYAAPTSVQYSPNSQNYPSKREDLERFYHKQQHIQLQQQQQKQQQIIDTKSRQQQPAESYKQSIAMPALSPAQKWATNVQQRPTSVNRKELSSSPFYNQISEFSSPKDISSRHSKHYSQAQLVNMHQSGRSAASLKYGFLKPEEAGRVSDPLLKGPSLSHRIPGTLPAGGVREESRRALPAGGVREESRRALSRRTSYVEGSSAYPVSDPGRMSEMSRRKESASSLPERTSSYRSEIEAGKMPVGHGSDVILLMESRSDGHDNGSMRRLLPSSADEEMAKATARHHHHHGTNASTPSMSASLSNGAGSMTLPSSAPTTPRLGDDKANPIDVNKVHSPSPFSSPLTVSIPQSPVTIPSPAVSPLQPTSSSTSASSTPTPMQSAANSRPPIVGSTPASHKAWSRKQMILNAVNQDESLKRIISNTANKHEPGGISSECKSRILAAGSGSTGSPVPASPKMPILSPHEDENEVVRGEEQRVMTPADDDEAPPTLDPIKAGRHGKPTSASSRVFSHGQPPPPPPPPAQSSNTGTGAAVIVGDSPLATSGKAVAGTSNPSKALSDTSATSRNSSNNVDDKPDETPSSVNSVVVRRISIGTAPPDGTQPLAVDETTGAKLSASGNSPFPRSEVIRRNSLTSHALNDRPWGHTKNIPIANVAPFVHSRSDDEKAKNKQDRRSNSNSSNVNNSASENTENGSTNNNGVSPQSRSISSSNKNGNNNSIHDSPQEETPESPLPIKQKKSKNSNSELITKVDKEKEDSLSSLLASSSSKKSSLCPKKKKVAKLRVSSPTKMKELELISPSLEYTVLKSSQMDDLRAIERLSQQSGGKKLPLSSRLKRKHKLNVERNVLKVKKVVRKRIRYAFREGVDDDDEDNDNETVDNDGSDKDGEQEEDAHERKRRVIDDDDDEEENEKDEDEDEEAEGDLDDDDEDDEGTRGKGRTPRKKDAAARARDREQRALRRGQLRDQSSEGTPPPVKRSSQRERESSSNTSSSTRRTASSRSRKELAPTAEIPAHSGKTSTRQAASRITRRRISSTNQKAQELKHNAMVQRRLTGKRNIRHYNRNAAYEQELHREANRHAVVRAKRQASNRARERLQQQQHRERLQDGEEVADEDNDPAAGGDETWEVPETRGGSRKVGHHTHGPKTGHTIQQQHGNVGVTKNAISGGGGRTNQPAVPASKHTPAAVASTSASSGRKEDYESDVEDVPDDLAEEMAAVSAKGRKKNKGKNKVGKQQRDKERAGGDTDVQTVGASGQEALAGEDDCFYPSASCPESTSPKIPIENVPAPADVKKLSINKNSGETLLHRAARLGHEEITVYCLKTQIIPVNARDNAGYTPLHESCVRGSVVVARHLIYYGADVNCCSQDGIRPIHDAIENDHVEVVRLLLTHGADPLIATYAGRTPVRIANSLLMLQTLQGYIADMNGWRDHEENENDEEEDERRQVEIPWRFTSSLAIYDNILECGGSSPWVDMPGDPPDDSCDVFDDGPTSAVNVFNLAVEGEERTPQPFCLLDDVMHRLNLHKDKLNLLHPWERSSITLSSERVREVASCCCSNVSIRLPQSGSVTLLPFSTLKGIEQALIERSKQQQKEKEKEERTVKEEKEKERKSTSSNKEHKGSSGSGLVVKQEDDGSTPPLPTKAGGHHREKPEKCSPLERGLGGISLKEGEKKHSFLVSSKSKSGGGSQVSSSSSSSSPSSSSSIVTTSAPNLLSSSFGNAIKRDSGSKTSFSTSSSSKSVNSSSHSNLTSGKSSSSSSSSSSLMTTNSDNKKSSGGGDKESKVSQSQHQSSFYSRQQHQQSSSSSSSTSSQSLQKHHYSHHPHHHQRHHYHHNNQPQSNEKRSSNPGRTPSSHHPPQYSTTSSSLPNFSPPSFSTTPASSSNSAQKSNRPHSVFISTVSTPNIITNNNNNNKNNNNNSSNKNKNDILTATSDTNNTIGSNHDNNNSSKHSSHSHKNTVVTTTSNINTSSVTSHHSSSSSSSSSVFSSKKSKKDSTRPTTPQPLSTTTSTTTSTPVISSESGWGSNPMFSDDSSSSPFHSATIDCFDSDNSP